MNLPQTDTQCPACRRSMFLQPSAIGWVQDARCSHGHSWQVARFQPPSLPAVAKAELAIGQDSTCVNHPSKKATAVCDGTGDYICSLCAVPKDGRIYSATHLANNADTHANNPARSLTNLPTIERPDSAVVFWLWIGVLLGLPTLGIGAVIGYIVALVKFKQHTDKRKHDPYHRHLTQATTRNLAIALVLIPIAVVLFFIWATEWFAH